MITSFVPFETVNFGAIGTGVSVSQCEDTCCSCCAVPYCYGIIFSFIILKKGAYPENVHMFCTILANLEFLCCVVELFECLDLIVSLCISAYLSVCRWLDLEWPCFLFLFPESYVYEDPAVVYEGVVADPDPIDLESYLVSFSFFSTLFWRFFLFLSSSNSFVLRQPYAV